MSTRLKITIVHNESIRTFKQYAEGESKDEFRSRAIGAMKLSEGEQYYIFEQEGHISPGHVHENCWGMRMIYHMYGSDERLPGLFYLRKVNEKLKVTRMGVNVEKDTCHNTGTWLSGGVTAAGSSFDKVQGDTSSSLSGCYGKPEEYYHYLAEGAVFVDKRAVPSDSLISGVISGPMLSLSIGPNQVKTFATGITEDITPDFDPKSLDCVGINVYTEFWAKLGARIGYRRGDDMHWNDGSVEPIQKCECWKGYCFSCNKLRYYVDRIYSPGGEARSRMPSGPHDHCVECRRASEVISAS